VELVEFREMFPEISATDYPDSYVQIWLNLANETVSKDVFGVGTYGLATAQGFLAAHYVTIDDNAMATSQTVGGMSVTYGNGEDNSDLSLTSYGRIYMRLVRLYGAGGLVV
jgi:hypothetical protein